MRRTNFYTLAKMKKENDLLFSDNGRHKIFIDLKGLDNAFITREMIEQIKPEIIKYICGSVIEGSSYCLKAVNHDNGTENYIDIDFSIQKVFSKKSGKLLYTYKEITGFSVNSYKINIYGVVPSGEMPCATVTYGTMENSSIKRLIYPDVEI